MNADQHWASSGAMHLTGQADGAPLAPPTRAAALAGQIASRFGADARVLGERAAILGLSRRGSTSCGGATQIVPAADGWLAISLPRPDDLELLPALCGVEATTTASAWPSIRKVAGHWPARDFAERAAALGMACAVVDSHASDPNTPPIAPIPSGNLDWRADPPLVVDLSALWAGPLCASLLARVGARVIKIEDPRRPDGARRGSTYFYDLLNGGKESLALDFSCTADRAFLTSMLERADIVISSSRARAFDQLGIDIDNIVESGTPTVWIALTAYGWHDARVGFGDDVAAAAGLIAWDSERNTPVFASDAIADPLSGLVGAAHAAAAFEARKSEFIDISMASICASVSHRAKDRTRAATMTPAGWSHADVAVAVPKYRPRTSRAMELDENGDCLRGEFGR